VTARTGWSRRLDTLHADAIDRPVEPAEWNSTSTRARQASGAAIMLRAIASISDELHDASIDNLPGEIAEALERFAPGFDLSLLDTYPQAALDGLTNALKGALFELKVADGIEAGSIPIPDGAAGFHLVDDFGTPGFDANLLDSHGHVIEVVQLKTSSSDHIIREALRKYPGIDHFMASHEAATAAAQHGIPHVVDTGISDAALSHSVAGALVDQTTTSASDVFDEIIPQITYAIIAGQLAYKIYKGTPRSEAVGWARDRLKDATVTSVIAGLAATATGTDAVRIPTVLGIRLTKGAVAGLDRTASTVHDFGLAVDQLASARTASASAPPRVPPRS